MSEEKKTAVTEEVKEEVRKLTEEEIAQVNGGVACPSPAGKRVRVLHDVIVTAGCEADDYR